MKKPFLLILLLSIMISGLALANNQQFGSVQSSQSTKPIRRIQSLSDGVVLTETFRTDNTSQLTENYASNQTSATLTHAPTQGNVLIAAIGINTYRMWLLTPQTSQA